MKGNNILITVLCLGVGFLAYSYYSDKKAPFKNETAIQKNATDSAEFIKSKTKDVSQSAQNLAGDIQKQTMAVTTNAKEAAEQMALQIKELVENAKVYLDHGEYKKAIESARNALNINPDSVEAKKIFDDASAKLSALSAEKTKEFKTNITEKIDETKAALGK